MIVDPKTIKKTVYLYGVSSAEIAGLEYSDALLYKVEMANDLIGRLLEEELFSRDTDRINACVKAVKFNEELLEEIEYDKDSIHRENISTSSSTS